MSAYQWNDHDGCPSPTATEKPVDAAMPCSDERPHGDWTCPKCSEAKSALLEIYEAMRLYEADVDGEAPSAHHRMMDRIRGILFEANAKEMRS